MRFWMEADRGDVVEGWVVPDNPVAISRIRASSAGRRLAEISATLTDPTLRERGWHATGQCGFRIGEANLPELRSLERLEIHDSDTNVLVHRRIPGAGLIERRVVLLNTSVHREIGLETALFPHFRQCYFGLEKLSGEILAALFEHPRLSSCLMSGSFTFPRYAPLLTGNGLSAILVQEPFVELAARLLALRERAVLANDPEQSWRLGASAPMAVLAAGCDFADPRSLRTFLRGLPLSALPEMDNPLTRLLTVERLADRIVATDAKGALDALLRIHVIGHRDHADLFGAALFERLSLAARPPGSAPSPEPTRILADRLRRLDIAEQLVAFDLELSEAVRSSVRESWDA